MNINEKIFNTMEEKHLKQADLARILNLKTGTITNWKVRGTTPPMEYAATICEFLGISIYELLDIKNKNDIQAAYEKADPAIQEAVRKLLDVEIEKTTYRRAGRGTRVNKLEDWKKKHNLT